MMSSGSRPKLIGDVRTHESNNENLRFLNVIGFYSSLRNNDMGNDQKENRIHFDVFGFISIHGRVISAHFDNFLVCILLQKNFLSPKSRQVKTSIFWIVILILALRVQGYWQDDRAETKARVRWIDKNAEMLESLADIACHEDNKIKNKEELDKLADRYIEKVWLVKFDADFDMLSNEEKVLFYMTAYQTTRLFHDKCFPAKSSAQI